MDENVIFKKGEEENQLNSAQAQEPVAQKFNETTNSGFITPQLSPSPSIPPPPLQQPPDYDPNFEKEGLSSFDFPIFSIFKVVIGIVILFIIGFLIMNIILPRLRLTSSKNANLNYWGLWENSSTMQVLIADFEKENSNIKITYKKQDIKEYREKLDARIVAGSGPDIFSFHNTWVIQMLGSLAPLPNEVIRKEEFQKEYYNVIQDDLVYKGAIYGVPSGIDTLALFVNEDLFKTAGVLVPTTWDDFANTARNLTVKDENGKIKTAGAAMGTFDNITHSSDIISLLFAQNGVDLKDLSKNIQNASDALNFYSDFAKQEGNVWDETLDPSILLFAKGNLAMYFGYSWDMFTIKALNPELSFKIHAVPYLTNRNITIASYWANGVSLKSKNQKEAFLFLKFLSKKDNAQKLFSESSKTRLFGQPYARVDLKDSLKSNALVYPFVEQAQNANSSYFASDTYDNGLNSQMNSYLGNAVRSILNDTSSQTASETLSQGFNQVLTQYGL